MVQKKEVKFDPKKIFKSNRDIETYNKDDGTFSDILASISRYAYPSKIYNEKGQVIWKAPEYNKVSGYDNYFRAYDKMRNKLSKVSADRVIGQMQKSKSAGDNPYFFIIKSE